MSWVCPGSSQTPEVNANNIIADQNTFFSWFKGSERNNCETVKSSDVYNALLRFQGSNPTPTSTDVSYYYTDIANNKKILEEKQRDANIAKDRASSIVRPELKSSYYDSWFPLNRPLKRAAIPVIIFFSSFFIVVSFFLLLGIIEIKTIFYVMVPDSSKSGSMTKPFFILLIATIILFSLTIYAFMK
jgi:hypothetical protein